MYLMWLSCKQKTKISLSRAIQTKLLIVMNLTNLAVISITESVLRLALYLGASLVFVLTFVVKAESVRTQNNQTD